MEIKLLALDLDGTVLRTDNTLAPEVKDSIKQAIDGGIEVAVASGRPFSSMPKDVLAIDGISWVVASNGAAIYKNGIRAHSDTLSEADVLRVLDLTKEHDLIWEAFLEGETCTFDTVWNTVYAYMDFIIPSGQYELSFDWRCLGGDESYMCAGVGIANQMKEMVSDYERAEFPTYIQGFATPENRVVRGNSRWQHANINFASNGTRVYRLYFAWRNKNRDAKLANPVSACIDNIQITTRNCAKPANLNAEVVGDSVIVTWTGTSAQYCVEYRRYGRERWSVQTGVRDERFVVEGLDEGAYDFRVRGVCNDIDTSAYTYRNSFGVYYPDRHCINYVDLHGPDVEATYGTFQNPYLNTGVVDTAYTDDPKFQRHVINWDPDEYDPRTGGR